MGVVFTDNVSLRLFSAASQIPVGDLIDELPIFLFLHQSFLYLVWYTTMSILGHYNNFFFAAHLLDIAMGFKTLRTILSSVTHNGKQVRVRRQFLLPAAGVTAESEPGLQPAACQSPHFQPQTSLFSYHASCPLMASLVTLSHGVVLV